MNRKMLCLLIIFMFMVPAVAGAVTKQDFKVKTTKNLLNLCNAGVDDPLYVAAIHFCEGYLVGAFHYYTAESKGPDGKKLVCLPDPPPTRNQAVKMFLQWAKEHPEYNNEMPVETEFRFLSDKWPCKE